MSCFFGQFSVRNYKISPKIPFPSLILMLESSSIRSLANHPRGRRGCSIHPSSTKPTRSFSATTVSYRKYNYIQCSPKDSLLAWRQLGTWTARSGCTLSSAELSLYWGSFKSWKSKLWSTFDILIFFKEIILPDNVCLVSWRALKASILLW